MAEEQPSYKLIYFNARGRAEHIRYILAYAGVEYTDERVSKERWPELKKSKTSLIKKLKLACAYNLHDGSKSAKLGEITICSFCFKSF